MYISFFCCNTDSVLEIAGRKLYDLFIKNNILLHLGGNVASQRVFDTNIVPYELRIKRFKKGVGLLKNFVEDDNTIFENEVETVFILIPEFD